MTWFCYITTVCQTSYRKSHIFVSYTKQGALHILSGATSAFKNNLNKENPPMWSKQILHVWVQNEEAGNIVYKVVKELPDEEVSGILVVISIANNSDFIFSNKINDTDPPKVRLLKQILKYMKTDSPTRGKLSNLINWLLEREN